MSWDQQAKGLNENKILSLQKDFTRGRNWDLYRKGGWAKIRPFGPNPFENISTYTPEFLIYGGVVYKLILSTYA